MITTRPDFGDDYRRLINAVWPPRPRPYFGPFALPRGAPIPLVIAATHDPSTPYAGAAGLIHAMRRGRLVTVLGDAHTMYPGNSACVDAAVEAYSEHATLPARGARCKQSARANG